LADTSWNRTNRRHSNHRPLGRIRALHCWQSWKKRHESKGIVSVLS
jgi:hypothetical protein